MSKGTSHHTAPSYSISTAWRHKNVARYPDTETIKALLGARNNINTIKSASTVLDASRDDGLAINVKETLCMLTYRHQNPQEKGKGKVVPVLNYAPRHKDVSKNGGIAPRSGHLTPREGPLRYSFDRRLG